MLPNDKKNYHFIKIIHSFFILLVSHGILGLTEMWQRSVV